MNTITGEAVAITSPLTLVEHDLDPQAAALYQSLKSLLDALTVTDQDVGVVIADNARNLYVGTSSFAIGEASVVVTIGITMANTAYNVTLTLGDGLVEHNVTYSTRTTTTFTAHRFGGTSAALDFSWLVAY